MWGVIYHCQIHCLTSLAETAVSLGAHQRGGGGGVAAAQPKSILPHSPDVLNTHPPISSYSSSPILSREQLRGTEWSERMNLTVLPFQNGYFFFITVTLWKVTDWEEDREGERIPCSVLQHSFCSTAEMWQQLQQQQERQAAHGHVDDMRKNQRKQVNGGMLEESIALV